MYTRTHTHSAMLESPLTIAQANCTVVGSVWLVRLTETIQECEMLPLLPHKQLMHVRFSLEPDPSASARMHFSVQGSVDNAKRSKLYVFVHYKPCIIIHVQTLSGTSVAAPFGTQQMHGTKLTPAIASRLVPTLNSPRGMCFN